MPPTELPGFNPHGVRGFALPSTDDVTVHACPTRGLDVLDVRRGDTPLMWTHPAGHFGRPIGDLDHIEGFFTAGVENVGPPSMGLPLHGTFGWRCADELQSGEDDDGPYVAGVLRCTDMVRGPYLDVHRRVTALRDRPGFRVEDQLRATVASEFMWLYHPNFRVADGTRLVANPRTITARDEIADRGIERWADFDDVGIGHAALPPDASREQNFERCYVVDLRPDDDGGVTSMLVAADGGSGACVRYRGDFDNAQSKIHLWKNNRGGVCGMERGQTFKGRQWATENGLMSVVTPGSPRRYTVEVTFPSTAEAVADIVDRYDLGTTTPELRDSSHDLVSAYRPS